MSTTLVRRGFLALGATSAVALSSCGVAPVDASRATFVLVHGAAHGGWCWKRPRDLLHAAGAEVFTPALAGLGYRSHRNAPDIDLSTHIQDVVNVFAFDELKDVVLVGHSYAGMVISGVADRLAERVRHLVYLDAVVPLSGENLLDATGAPHDALPVDALFVDPDYAYDFGIKDADDLAWVRRHLRPQSAATFREPLTLANGLSGVKRSYIACTADRGTGSLAETMRERARGRLDASWGYHEVETGHDAMITAPKELADLLLRIAAG